MISDLISERRSGYMSSQEKLIQRATEKILGELGIEDVLTLKARFDEILIAIEVETYRLYLEDEKKMISELIVEILLRPLPGPGPYTRDELAGLPDAAAAQLRDLLIHLRRSRRNKAGAVERWRQKAGSAP